VTTKLDPRGLQFMTCLAIGDHPPVVDAATGEASCERCGAALPPVPVVEEPPRDVSEAA